LFVHHQQESQQIIKIINIINITMDCYYFNSFANICKENNYKLNSNFDRFADDMDMDKFEQLRTDYSDGAPRINNFSDYIRNAHEAMQSLGLYLCDEGGSPCGPELHQIVTEFCNEHHRAENSTVPQNEDDDCESVCSIDALLEDDFPPTPTTPPTTPACLGCIEDQPNQLAHMGHGGCLEIGDEYDLTDTDDTDDIDDEDLVEISRQLNFDEEDVAVPDGLTVSMNSSSALNFYAGNYKKTDRIVRGAPLYMKTNARGNKFFLFRGSMGHWLFSDDEQDVRTCLAAISSTSATELPCEQGIRYEVALDIDTINEEEGWRVDESIVVRAGHDLYEAAAPPAEVVWLGGGARN
jgi:hypothetical protein